MRHKLGFDDRRELASEELYDVLSNDRRRMTLRQLAERTDGTISVGELADSVAAAEADTDEPPQGLRSSVYAALVQNHLPMMDERDVVDYDDSEQIVSRTDYTAEVCAHLEYTPRTHLWPMYYLLVVVCSIAFLALVRLSVPPFGAFSEFGAAVVIVATLLVVVTAQFLATR